MITHAYEAMEILVKTEPNYTTIDVHTDAVRRIFTDGRDWPKDVEPAFIGYSIGKWIDTLRPGRYDTLEVETRDFKGPRAYDNSGRTLHRDNQSIIKERFFLDRADRNILHDEITVIDHALTRPWVVMKSYKRDPSPQPYWHEEVCPEANPHLRIGAEIYMLSADGYLMPQKKGQKPPDLRYFEQVKK